MSNTGNSENFDFPDDDNRDHFADLGYVGRGEPLPKAPEPEVAAKRSPRDGSNRIERQELPQPKVREFVPDPLLRRVAVAAARRNLHQPANNGVSQQDTPELWSRIQEKVDQEHAEQIRAIEEDLGLGTQHDR